MLVRPEKRRTLARRGTSLVIEGFPRSGNTFSVAAFQVANGGSHHLGRHLHGAPHLMRAARLGVPAVLLVRRPADAIASYLVRRPQLTAVDAALEYVDFYDSAWRVRDHYVVGLFDVVVSDFGRVVEAVNARFGTPFRPYVATPENEAAAFALVEEMNRLECRGEVLETHVGRPSAEREARKAEVAAQLDMPAVRRLLARGDELFARYRDRAEAASG